MEFIYAKVHTPGLLVVTGTTDWARNYQGGNNSEANVILYHVLTTGTHLANWAGDTTGLSQKWTSMAADLKSAIMTYLWDDEFGALKNNATVTKMYPQDANSLAILFGAVDANSTYAQSISIRLTENWTPIGAIPPERPDSISPFVSSFEIQAHLISGQTGRVLDLIRRSWGWYLNHPNGTQSTCIEGYSPDGSFSYVYGNNGFDSHSHGWSSGPTSTLTEYVLGLKVTEPIGSSWRFASHLASDLWNVEGGFTTKLGKFQASWTKQQDGYRADVNTPNMTKGELILPGVVKGEMPIVLLDGIEVSPEWYMKSDLVMDTVIVHTNGGNHVIDVTPGPSNASSPWLMTTTRTSIVLASDPTTYTNSANITTPSKLVSESTLTHFGTSGLTKSNDNKDSESRRMDCSFMIIIILVVVAIYCHV